MDYVTNAPESQAPQALSGNSNQLLDHARRYLSAGLCVVPSNIEKRPAIGHWKEFQKRRPTATEIEEWFSRPNKIGIGLITGATSGNLEVIDFDEADRFDRFMDLAEQCGLADLVRSLPQEMTPRPGRHLFYRAPSIEGNLKLALMQDGVDDLGDPEVKTLIETRGEGGFIVVSPTPGKCHETGRPYVMVSGDLCNIPSITDEQRAELLNLARSFNEYIPETKCNMGKREDRRDERNGDGLRPGDDFNARATWSEIMEPHRWRFVYSRGDVSHWRRPGKDRGAPSATTNFAGSGLLYVFSTNAHPFEHERGYSKFSAYALLNHGGDFTAAARDLGQQGYGEQRTSRTCIEPEEKTLARDPQAVLADLRARIEEEPSKAASAISDLLKRDPDIAALAGMPSAHFAAELIELEAFGVKKDHIDDLRKAVKDAAKDAEKVRQTAPRGDGASRTALAPEWGTALTDQGNSERFVTQHGKNVLWVDDLKEYRVWDGCVWQRDSTRMLDLMAQQTVRGIYEEAARAMDSGERAAIAKHARESESQKKRAWMLEGARCHVAERAEAFDSLTRSVCLQNGVLELDTGALRPHRREDRLTKLLPHEWRGPDCPAPRWGKFIREILEPDPDGLLQRLKCSPEEAHEETIAYVRRLFGYAFAGTHQEENVIAFFVGRGRNGKRVLFETLKAVFGPYAGMVPAESIMAGNVRQRGAASPDLCAYQGVRLAIVAETAEGGALNAEAVKALTGGDPISARPLYGRQFEFPPTHLLCVQTNHAPRAPRGDYAFWQRAALIPFGLSFVPKPSKPFERQRDPRLIEKLSEEASGILSWLYRGFQEWREQGLNTPAFISTATEEYRESADPFASFVHECCLVQPAKFVTLSALYQEYAGWCEADGAKPIGKQQFNSHIEQIDGVEKQRTHQGWCWCGIGLLSPGSGPRTESPNEEDEEEHEISHEQHYRF